jgi:uncharacterized protein YcgL (UPF0745 family)
MVDTDINNTYIYIDESGDLTSIDKGGKPIFIIGCIITDNPISLNNKVEKLKEEIKNSAYYFRNKDNFEKDGFHASTNHPDIYSRFVSLLNTLNFRSYILLIDKNNQDFEQKLKERDDLYYYLLKILLKDRILKRKNDIIHIIIEQSSKKHKIEKSKIQSVLSEINDTLIREGFIKNKINFDFKIQGKNEDAGIDIIDYINHIIFTAKVGNEKGEKFPRLEENTDLIEPKVALVYNLLNGKYYVSRKKEPLSLYNFLNSI